MVAGDMNCHIGSTRDGFEDVIGCFSFGVRNQEGESMLDLRVMDSLLKEVERSHHIQEWG